MKTEDVLNLNCEEEKNKQLLNKFIWKIKPCAKLFEKNHYTETEIIPIELLEQALHKIMEKFDYKSQGIEMYMENGKFIFYTNSIVKKRDIVEWIGNTYGKTLWEVIAKTIIKIYADIKGEKKK